MRTRAECALPSPDTSVSATAMCAGALTIAGLAWAPVIMNVAGMRGPVAEGPVGEVGVAVDVEGVEVEAVVDGGAGALVDWVREAVLAVLVVGTLAVVGAAA